LVAAHGQRQTQGASCALQPGEKFHELCKSQITDVFDVYDTEAAAVSSFQAVLAASNSANIVKAFHKPKRRICYPLQKPEIDKRKVRDQLKHERICC